MNDTTCVTDFIRKRRSLLNAYKKENILAMTRGMEVQETEAFQFSDPQLDDIQNIAREVKLADNTPVEGGAVLSYHQAHLTPSTDSKSFSWFYASTPDTAGYIPRVAFLDEIQNLAHSNGFQTSVAAEWPCTYNVQNDSSFPAETSQQLEHNCFDNLIEPKTQRIGLQQPWTIYADAERTSQCCKSDRLLELYEYNWRANVNFEFSDSELEKSRFSFSDSKESDETQRADEPEGWHSLDHDRGQMECDKFSQTSRDELILAANYTKDGVQDAQENQEFTCSCSSSATAPSHQCNGPVSPTSVLSPESGGISDAIQQQDESCKQIELIAETINASVIGNDCNYEQISQATSDIRFATDQVSATESFHNSTLLEIDYNLYEYSLDNCQQEETRCHLKNNAKTEPKEQTSEWKRYSWESNHAVPGRNRLPCAHINSLLCSTGFPPIKCLTSPDELCAALVDVMHHYQRRENLVQELLEETTKFRQSEEQNAMYVQKLECELEAAKKNCINLEQRSQINAAAAEKANSALRKESQQVETANLNLLQRCSQLEHACRAKERDGQKYQNKLLEVIEKEERQTSKEKEMFEKLENKLSRAEIEMEGGKRRSSLHQEFKPRQIVKFYERQKAIMEAEITTLRIQVTNLCSLLRDQENFTSRKVPIDSIFEMFGALPRIEKFVEDICNVVFYEGENFLPRKHLTKSPEEVPGILMYWLELLQHYLIV